MRHEHDTNLRRSGRGLARRSFPPGLGTLGILLLLAGVTSARDGDGIAWEVDLPAGLARAAAEGRPTLLAINALETEAANQRLATELYRSAPWGEATRAWVALVANPNVHGAGDVCTRYEGGQPCATHQAVLRYVIRRFAPQGDLISPQHLILDPDERLAFRKEYYTGVVGPVFLERWLSRISPNLALERAADLRADAIDALEDVPLPELTDRAAEWLRSDDPLAAAAVLRATDYALDPLRRRALVASFAHVAPDHLDVPWIAAYDAVVDAADEPELARAWVEAMLAADPDRGHALAARAAVHAGSSTAAGPFLTLLFDGGAPPSRLTKAGADPLGRLRAEAYLLLGRPVAPDAAALRGDGRVEARRVRRAQAKSGTGRKGASLTEALEPTASVAALRRALLEATPEEVRAHEAEVRTLFRDRPEERLRVAAALAMLGAGLDEGGRVPEVVTQAVFDVVETTDIRPEAVRRLGSDPGYGEDAWREALRAHLEGAR